MADVLQGEGTASMYISNVALLKIQLADEDSISYQFFDVADNKPDEIVQVPIVYLYDEDDLEDKMAFYLKDDTEQETPYYISEFVRDDFPAITSWLPKGVPAQGIDLLPDGIGKGLPEGRITEVYGRTSYHK